MTTLFSMPVFVRRRILALCALCSLVFVLHAAYFLAIATGVVNWREGYPNTMHVYVFDAIFYSLLELLPSIAILFMISRKKASPSHAYMDINSNPYTVSPHTLSLSSLF